LDLLAHLSFTSNIVGQVGRGEDGAETTILIQANGWFVVQPNAQADTLGALLGSLDQDGRQEGMAEAATLVKCGQANGLYLGFITFGPVQPGKPAG